MGSPLTGRCRCRPQTSPGFQASLQSITRKGAALLPEPATPVPLREHRGDAVGPEPPVTSRFCIQVASGASHTAVNRELGRS